MRNIGLGCTPMSITICGQGPPFKAVKPPYESTPIKLCLPVSTGRVINNFTFDITNVYSSRDYEENSITDLPMLFDNSSLLMINTLSYESENQSNEIKLVYPQLINYDQ